MHPENANLFCWFCGIYLFIFIMTKKNTNAGILPRKMKRTSEKQLNYLNLHIDHREEDLRGQTKQ